MHDFAKTIARQEIEYLRRLYAKATDMIGTNRPALVAEGSEIYSRIFTPDVNIVSYDQAGEIGYESEGANGWVDVVADALKVYTATQHLIGTQIVDLQQLDLDDSGQVTAGQAQMESYLQAWHENDKKAVLWLFIGTYTDKVRYVPGIGWQIYEMALNQVAGERRALGTDAAE